MKHSYRAFAILLSFLILLIPNYQVFAVDAQEIDAPFPVITTAPINDRSQRDGD